MKNYSYEQRVNELEAQGLTRSDAQGVVDAEILKEGKNMDDKKEKFTPGPWKIRKTDNAIRRLTGAKTPSEVQANAHLIAAAPDMYEALEILKFELEAREADGHKVSGLLNVIDITLSKARGES